jgi:oxygen-independent coproporphyrinogen-3 oxidase
METLGLYIQVPFCASKCSFCNFSSKVALAGALDAYCRALEHEIVHLPALYEARQIGLEVLTLPADTVYIGGGTPTLLGGERLEGIVSALRARFEVAKTTEPVEFTLEAAPGSADDDLLGALLRLGANRLSIGAQSFDDRELRAVGRLHSAAATCDLVSRARLAGFENVSLDLIAGLPYQNESSWLRSLREVARLRPEHVSVYLFEVDEKSRLGNEVLRQGARYGADHVPGDEFMADAYETACGVLSQEGYLQYEISNFALPAPSRRPRPPRCAGSGGLGGFQSRHNRRYWQLKPYVGLGAGAHSFDGQRRWANETAPETYQEKLERRASPIAELQVLAPEQQLEEFFFLGLRMRQGVDLTTARQRWGEDLVARWEPRISALGAEGWLEADGDCVRLAQQALLVSNEVFQQFVLGS